MSDITNKWQKIKLGDISEVIGGGTPSTKNYDFWDGEIPWLTPKDLSGYKNRYISRGERNISEKGLQNSSARMLPKGTVLLTSRAPIGYLAIAENAVCTNQGFKSLVLKDNYLPEFFYYLLKNNIEYIIGMSSGSTFAEISGKQVKALEFRVPPLLTQKKIAAVLSALDDKIELNNKINQNLEHQAQAIFKSWFVDFEPFGGKMPDDWKIGKLKESADRIVCGKTPSTKKVDYYGNDVPFITIPDMHNNVYITKTERSLSVKGANSQANKTIPCNSICVSCIGTAGLVSLTSENSQTNQQINSILPKSNISPYFIYLQMQSLSSSIQMLGAAGSTICNLNKSQFSDMEFLLPNIDILSKFHDRVKFYFSLILSNQRENLRLAQLRDALLPKLMSGEIDVSNVDISDNQISFNFSEV